MAAGAGAEVPMVVEGGEEVAAAKEEEEVVVVEVEVATE